MPHQEIVVFITPMEEVDSPVAVDGLILIELTLSKIEDTPLTL